MMLRSPSRSACVVAAAGAAASLFIVTGALADVPGTVVQARKNLSTGATATVPGIPLATQTAIANAGGSPIVWNEPTTANPGFSPNAGNPVIDAAGNIYFPGTMAQNSFTDPDTLATVFVTGATSNFSANGQSNNRGLFFASAASGWANSAITMIARDGSTSSNVSGATGTSPLLGGTSVPLTGVPAGSVLNGSANAAGMSTSIAVSANGTVMFNSLVAPYVNSTTGTGTNIGASFFTGNSSGFASSGMHTNALDGTTGATLALTASQTTTQTAVNNLGQFAFVATPTGGDTVTSGAQQNNSGIWRFSGSGNTKIMRRGDAAPGAVDSGSGSNAAFGAAPINNNVRINGAGDVLFPQTLATSTVPSGFTGAAAERAGVVYVKPNTGSLQLVAQSGTAVPGIAGVNYLNTTNPAVVTQQMLNNSGTVLFNTKFNPATAATNPSTGITANTNDQAIMKWTSGGGGQAMFQTGVTSVPGVGGATTFRDLGYSNSQTRLNNLNHYTFSAAMTAGAGIFPASAGVPGTDTGLWLGDGTIGGATLIARGGDVAPGTGGLLFGNSFVGVIMNNADQVIFQNTAVNASGQNVLSVLYAWGPTFGLVPLFAQGNTSLLGANYPISASLASYDSRSNGDGGVMSLNDNGQFAFFANSAGAGGAFGTNNVLVVMQIPAPGAGALALLGLGALARRRRR